MSTLKYYRVKIEYRKFATRQFPTGRWHGARTRTHARSLARTRSHAPTRTHARRRSFRYLPQTIVPIEPTAPAPAAPAGMVEIPGTASYVFSVRRLTHLCGTLRTPDYSGPPE